jgi:ABC-type lipoprotein export system ATPase subunit
MSEPSTVISARGLRKRFSPGSDWVLDGVDLAVLAGERVAIVGPSGSGKSTLLALLGSLDSADAGEVNLGGQRFGALSGDELAALRREAIGFVFQDHHLLPQCTALQNVLLPLLARPSGGPSAAEQERGRALLAGLGLQGRDDAWPHQLSTGERQRVAVARALIGTPRLLLADEPTGSLDRQSAEALLPLLLQPAEVSAVLVVTHSEQVAAACDRVLVMEDGRLRERGQG